MGIYIEGMKMPKEGHWETIRIYPTGECAVPNWQGDCTLIKGAKAIEVPDHGRLIDADALIEDLKRQCKEVFRIDAVSPDDYWIIRDTAYNQRLWQSWCEGFYEYLGSRPTIIPAETPEEET